jgi:hypothetical protein
MNIYAASRGGILRIDGHGLATFEVPCDVPERVAAELCASGEFVGSQPSSSAAAPSQPETVGVYRASRGTVHHVRADCHVGNNIEASSRRPGEGDLPLCGECERLLLGAAESEA